MDCVLKVVAGARQYLTSLWQGRDEGNTEQAPLLREEILVAEQLMPNFDVYQSVNPSPTMDNDLEMDDIELALAHGISEEEIEGYEADNSKKNMIIPEENGGVILSSLLKMNHAIEHEDSPVPVDEDSPMPEAELNVIDKEAQKDTVMAEEAPPKGGITNHVENDNGTNQENHDNPLTAANGQNTTTRKFENCWNSGVIRDEIEDEHENQGKVAFQNFPATTTEWAVQLRHPMPFVFPQGLGGTAWEEADDMSEAIAMKSSLLRSALASAKINGETEEVWRIFFAINTFSFDQGGCDVFLAWHPHFPHRADSIRSVIFEETWSHDVVRQSSKCGRTLYRPFRVLRRCRNVERVELRWTIGKCPGFTGQEHKIYKSLRELEMVDRWNTRYHAEDLFVHGKKIEELHLRVFYDRSWAYGVSRNDADLWELKIRGYFMNAAVKSGRMYGAVKITLHWERVEPSRD